MYVPANTAGVPTTTVGVPFMRSLYNLSGIEVFVREAVKLLN